MRRVQGSDISVTKEDQANINAFSKLHSKYQDNQGVLASINEKINQHKDTLDELELNSDDDMVRYRFGMCFFSLTSNCKIMQLNRPEPSSKKILPVSKPRRLLLTKKWKP